MDDKEEDYNRDEEEDYKGDEEGDYKGDEEEDNKGDYPRLATLCVSQNAGLRPETFAAPKVEKGTRAQDCIDMSSPPGCPAVSNNDHYMPEACIAIPA